MILSALMLTFNSNPIKIARELIKIIAMMTMMVPMDPYSTLYLPKLFTKTENKREDKIHRKVVAMVPGEFNFHLCFTEGAYLNMNPIPR